MSFFVVCFGIEISKIILCLFCLRSLLVSFLFLSSSKSTVMSSSKVIIPVVSGKSASIAFCNLIMPHNLRTLPMCVTSIAHLHHAISSQVLLLPMVFGSPWQNRVNPSFHILLLIPNGQLPLSNASWLNQELQGSQLCQTHSEDLHKLLFFYFLHYYNMFTVETSKIYH